MLKKTITYTDYNGDERTEDFYFNLTKAELMKLELGTVGGLTAKYNRIINAKDGEEIMREFDKIIALSYCEKSLDGRRLVKSPELYKAFTETEAFSELFMVLITDADAAANFFKGICPAVPETTDVSSIPAPPIK